jgi:hypothetical protein
VKQVIQSYNNIFYECISNYDLSDSNLLRKMIHSYEVARNCFSIASRRGMNKEERNFCYLMGLFHDIGRFKQWELYHTYDDVKSVDHGELSCTILENLECDKLFDLTFDKSCLLKESIRFHTKPYIGSDKKIIEYNDILKNADAFSNVISTASGMQQMTVDIDGAPSEVIANKFKNRELLVGLSPKTKVDRCLMLTACCYYVNDCYLREEILKNRYIDIIFEIFSKYLNDEDKLIYEEMIEDLKKNF